MFSKGYRDRRTCDVFILRSWGGRGWRGEDYVVEVGGVVAF